MSGPVALWSWLSPVVIGGSALAFIALERLLPYRRGQRLLRPGFWNDLVGYALIQSYLLGLVIARFIGWMDGATGLSRLHLVSAWPVPLQVGFFVVTHDLYIYLFHRLQHHSAFLWRIHEAHHATADVDWLSGSRSHALEILINQTIEFAPLTLLGAAPEVALIKLTIDAVWGMFIHSNIDVRSGRLQLIFNGPEMHRWHHAVEIRDGINFATKLAVWDWWFRTACLPARKPVGYGLYEGSFPRGFLGQQAFAFRRPRGRPRRVGSTIGALETLRYRELLRLVATRALALAVLVGRLLLVLLATVPCTISRLVAGRSRAVTSGPARRNATPRILFICGTLNHTTQLHQVAAALPDFEHAFTWYYCDGVLEAFRRLGWLRSTALGDKLRARCLAYLHAHALPLDLGGERGHYDLVITCSDMTVPRNITSGSLVLLQEGMTDPEDLVFRLVRALRLPPWLAITSAATGLSHAYDRLCVASDGYRELFEKKGARPETIVVTGIPNFDDCERFRTNDFPHHGFLLVCSSDIRETARWEDRPRFIRDVLHIAAGRPVIWKLHPNENATRARAELAALAPEALIYEHGSAEEMIANCAVLVTQYSSTAYVGLALGKEVHSFFDGAELRRLCPVQNGGTSARNVAAVCRALIEARRRDLAQSSPSTRHAPPPALLEDGSAMSG